MTFTLIAGPCVVENEVMPLEIAHEIQQMCNDLEIHFVFKASYRKANRTRVDSFQGIGDETALDVIAQVRNEIGCMVTTDVHAVEEIPLAAPRVDILQIPAFLCRQTDLLLAAGKTGRTINVKKGQFLSPESMRYVTQKIESAGNQKIILTERGTFFGYQDLVVDFRAIPLMQSIGYPVFMDCTHSLQQPNQQTGVSGGQPRMIESMARAATAVGADGLFIETHPKPEQALSDGQNMLPLAHLRPLLESCLKIRKAIYKV